MKQFYHKKTVETYDECFIEINSVINADYLGNQELIVVILTMKAYKILVLFNLLIGE